MTMHQIDKNEKRERERERERKREKNFVIEYHKKKILMLINLYLCTKLYRHKKTSIKSFK